MGKMGIWEGMGKEEEEKSGGKEKIFGRKNFLYHRKCTLWVRQSIAIDNVIWGARRRLVEGFYEVSDMELLIGLVEIRLVEIRLVEIMVSENFSIRAITLKVVKS